MFAEVRPLVRWILAVIGALITASPGILIRVLAVAEDAIGGPAWWLRVGIAVALIGAGSWLVVRFLKRPIAAILGGLAVGAVVTFVLAFLGGGV